MPELPEAETIARSLRGRIVGRRIVRVATRVPRLREPLAPAALGRACTGRRIEDVGRRGKGIVVELEDARAVLVNLGMTGTCRVCPAGRPLARHESVVFHLDDGRTWRYEDPRRFGMVQAFRRDRPATTPPFLTMLGPEPLGRGFTAAHLLAVCAGRHRAIKELLLDQRLVAGIGNIYASEILWRAGIDPRRAGGDLGAAEAATVVRATRAVLRAAIRAGGTTISNHRDPDGGEGRFQRHLGVYGRAGLPCARCGAAVAAFRQGGRISFGCPGCQA